MELIDRFPWFTMQILTKDYNDIDSTKCIRFAVPETVLKMTDDSGKSTEQLIKELEEKSI